MEKEEFSINRVNDSFTESTILYNAQLILKEKNKSVDFSSIFYSCQEIEDTYKKAAEIDKELRKKGVIIEPFDCVIAGIFIQNGVKKIIMRNVKHFSRIKEIEVITY